MTDEDFEALAFYMNQSSCKAAVRMVMVDRVASVDAAKLHGLSRSSVSNAIARLKEAHARAKVVAKIKLPDER